MKTARSIVVGLIAGAFCAPSLALAHVQVSPGIAAPDDSVRFEVLVPNERSVGTTSVSLKIPKGVLPFSFERTPGWTRTLENASDGSISIVRWKGRLDSDGFVRFSFLASTPPTTGPIEWKAIQGYSDGKDSAWIGPTNSDNPAPVTEISKSAPSLNAGGEGSGGQADGESATTPSANLGGKPPAEGGIRAETIALVLGIGALLLAAVALTVAIRRRPSE
ncbi:MAG: DUF1775 domain-containing protein [Actinomycetes bacterium]